MAKMDTYTFSSNGKDGVITYMPPDSIGDLARWHVKFNDGTNATWKVFVDISQYDNQLSAFLKSTKYESIIPNWEYFANFRDVAEMVIEYVGYTAENEVKDQMAISSFKNSVSSLSRELANDISDSATMDEISESLEAQLLLVRENYNNFKFTETRLNSYFDWDGRPFQVKRTWDNDSFRVLLLHLKKVNPEDSQLLKAFDILDKDYPDFL